MGPFIFSLKTRGKQVYNRYIFKQSEGCISWTVNMLDKRETFVWQTKISQENAHKMANFSFWLTYFEFYLNRCFTAHTHIHETGYKAWKRKRRKGATTTHDRLMIFAALEDQ